MAKKDKNIKSDPGKTAPVMRKSSTRKLGRGFSDIMGANYQKPSGRIQNTTQLPTINSNNFVEDANKTTKIPKIEVPDIEVSKSETAQIGLPNSETPFPGTSDVQTEVKQNIVDPNFNPDPVFDGDSIESVVTGTPKSKTKMGTISDRRKKRRRKKAKTTLIVLLVILLVSSAVAGVIYLFSSDIFKIEKIEINGVLHLTDEEIYALANVPDDETLLRVDSDTIAQRLKRDAWIKDVNINRVFPDTLQINVTERAIAAIVEVPTNKESGSSVSTSTSATSKETTVRMWAISADKIWLMPIPEQNSDIGKSINQQIYSDAAGILHIVDVLPSVSPEIGYYCTDDTLQCAIDVVASMTTELKTQVKYAKASDSQSTTLILNNGVEVAFGTSENMRDKERIVIDLLTKYEGKISFINVRNVNNPTWRTL